MTDTKLRASRVLIRKAAAKPVQTVKARSNKASGVSTGQAGIVVTDRDSHGKQPPTYVLYTKSKGVDEFVSSVHLAEPMLLIETERRGVASVFVKDLSKRMGLPAQRMFDIVGVPKATLERKVAEGGLLSGSGGRAALGIAKLLGMASEIVQDSTAPEAQGFDTAKWLGKWLETPQPALGGRKPAELVETPTGLEVVTRLLAAIRSGAYQ
jgi:putative toxin-antitoxin system antitoxin component (TIGR02293 family)